MDTNAHTDGEAPAFKATPLYIQVQAAVRQRIKGGTWKPGMPIPNEGDLAREMRVSSGTMRKALDALEAEGVLTRRQGRGTFVREQVDWADMSDDAQLLLAAIGGAGPSDKPLARVVIAGSGSFTADELRAMARGAIEIAAWLDRRAYLEHARAA